MINALKRRFKKSDGTGERSKLVDAGGRGGNGANGLAHGIENGYGT